MQGEWKCNGQRPGQSMSQPQRHERAESLTLHSCLNSNLSLMKPCLVSVPSSSSMFSITSTLLSTHYSCQPHWMICFPKTICCCLPLPFAHTWNALCSLPTWEVGNNPSTECHLLRVGPDHPHMRQVPLPLCSFRSCRLFLHCHHPCLWPPHPINSVLLAAGTCLFTAVF